MKAFLAILVLPLIGCGLLGIGSQGQLPEVWVVPVLQIRFEGTLVPGDGRLPKIRDFLADMNARIYDLTDGQVRIARIELYNGSQKPDTTPGIGTMREVQSNEGTGIIGLPNAPGYFRFSLHESFMERSYCIGVAAHEWLHAWVGLYDEYKKTGGAAYCPENGLVRLETDSCIMYNSWRTELCRHGSKYHSTATLQHEKHGMSCYEWFKKAVHDAGYGEITIPDKFYCGPDDPPDPAIEYRFVVSP